MAQPESKNRLSSVATLTTRFQTASGTMSLKPFCWELDEIGLCAAAESLISLCAKCLKQCNYSF